MAPFSDILWGDSIETSPGCSDRSGAFLLDKMLLAVRWWRQLLLHITSLRNS